jgi:hypothetical protein
LRVLMAGYTLAIHLEEDQIDAIRVHCRSVFRDRPIHARQMYHNHVRILDKVSHVCRSITNRDEILDTIADIIQGQGGHFRSTEVGESFIVLPRSAGSHATGFVASIMRFTVRVNVLYRIVNLVWSGILFPAISSNIQASGLIPL